MFEACLGRRHLEEHYGARLSSDDPFFDLVQIGSNDHANRRGQEHTMWYQVDNIPTSKVQILELIVTQNAFCDLSGGVVIYFDKIEVVNFLNADQGNQLIKS